MTVFPLPNRDASQMVWVRAPVSGAKWQVHREVAPLLQHVVTTAERRGYLFDHGPGDVDDDWGYSVRKIAGSSSWSWHSAGAAVDIDAQNYPQGQRSRVPPGWLIELFRQWGWDWGGTWRHADPMHFELPDRDRAARLRAVLYAAGLTGAAMPVPVGTPPPAPPKEMTVQVRCDVPGLKERGAIFHTVTGSKVRTPVQAQTHRQPLAAVTAKVEGAPDREVVITSGAEWDMFVRHWHRVEPDTAV